MNKKQWHDIWLKEKCHCHLMKLLNCRCEKCFITLETQQNRKRHTLRSGYTIMAAARSYKGDI